MATTTVMTLPSTRRSASTPLSMKTGKVGGGGGGGGANETGFELKSANETGFELKINDNNGGLLDHLLVHRTRSSSNRGRSRSRSHRAHSHSQSHRSVMSMISQQSDHLSEHDETTEEVLKRLAQVKKQRRKQHEQKKQKQPKQVGAVPNVTVLIGGRTTTLISDKNISPLPSPERPSKESSSTNNNMTSRSSPAAFAAAGVSKKGEAALKGQVTSLAKTSPDTMDDARKIVKDRSTIQKLHRNTQSHLRHSHFLPPPKPTPQPQPQRQLFDEYTAGSTKPTTGPPVLSRSASLGSGAISPSAKNFSSAVTAKAATLSRRNSTPTPPLPPSTMHRHPDDNRGLHRRRTRHHEKQSSPKLTSSTSSASSRSNFVDGAASPKTAGFDTSATLQQHEAQQHRGSSRNKSNRKRRSDADDDDITGVDDVSTIAFDDQMIDNDRTPRELIAMGAAVDHLCHGGKVSELTDVVEFEIRNPVNGTPLLRQTYELTGESVNGADQDGGRSLCGHPLVLDTFRDLSMIDNTDRHSRSHRSRSRSHHRSRNSSRDGGGGGEPRQGLSRDDNQDCNGSKENGCDGDGSVTLDTYGTALSPYRSRTLEGEQTVGNHSVETSIDRSHTDEGEQTVESRTVETSFDRRRTFETFDRYRTDGMLIQDTKESHPAVILPISKSFEKVARNYHLRSDDSDDLAASFDDDDDIGKDEASMTNDIPVYVYRVSEEEEETKQMAGCLGNNVVGGFVNLAIWQSLLADPPSLISEPNVLHDQQAIGEENNINDDNHSWSERYSMAVNGIAQRVQSLISLKTWNDDSFEQPDSIRKADSFDKSPTYSGTSLHDTPSKPDNSFTTEETKSESMHPNFRQFPVVSRFWTDEGTGTYVRKLDVSHEEPIEVDCDDTINPIDVSFEDSVEAYGIEVPMQNQPEARSIPRRPGPAQGRTPTRFVRSITVTGSGSTNTTPASTPQRRKPSFDAKEENNHQSVGGRQCLSSKKKKGLSSLRRVLWPSKPTSSKTPSKPKMSRVKLDDSLIRPN